MKISYEIEMSNTENMILQENKKLKLQNQQLKAEKTKLEI